MLVGGWVGAKLALAALAGVLAAAMVWVAVVRFGIPTLGRGHHRARVRRRRAARRCTATQVYPELPAALAVTLAIAALTGPLSRRALVGTGVCIVALPWLSVKYAPVAATLAVVAGVAVLARGDERRASLWFGGGLAIAGVAYLVAHQALVRRLDRLRERRPLRRRRDDRRRHRARLPGPGRPPRRAARRPRLRTRRVATRLPARRPGARVLRAAPAANAGPCSSRRSRSAG